MTPSIALLGLLAADPSSSVDAEKSWGELVREDPLLRRIERRARLRPAAIGMTAAGAAWLALTIGIRFDMRSMGRTQPTPAAEAIIWAFPATLFVSGVAMLIASGVARKRLQRERQRFMVAPYAGRTAAGLTFTRRF